MNFPPRVEAMIASTRFVDTEITLFDGVVSWECECAALWRCSVCFYF
jgi:hypothetical protein